MSPWKLKLQNILPKMMKFFENLLIEFPNLDWLVVLFVLEIWNAVQVFHVILRIYSFFRYWVFGIDGSTCSIRFSQNFITWSYSCKVEIPSYHCSIFTSWGNVSWESLEVFLGTLFHGLRILRSLFAHLSEFEILLC